MSRARPFLTLKTRERDWSESQGQRQAAGTTVPGFPGSFHAAPFPVPITGQSSWISILPHSTSSA